MTKQRQLRVGDRLEDDETIVIRGGGLEPGALRTDAQRCHTVYGHYGISVFAVRDAAIDEMAQQVPLSVSRSSRSCMSACCGPLGCASNQRAGIRDTSPWRSMSSTRGSRCSSPAITAAGPTRIVKTETTSR